MFNKEVFEGMRQTIKSIPDFESSENSESEYEIHKQLFGQMDRAEAINTIIEHLPDDEVSDAVYNSYAMRRAVEKVGLPHLILNFAAVRTIIKKLDLDISHWYVEMTKRGLTNAEQAEIIRERGIEE